MAALLLTGAQLAEWLERAASAIDKLGDQKLPAMPVEGGFTGQPEQRMAEVSNLQGAVLYLTSEASDHVTGHDLVIDGGYSLW